MRRHLSERQLIGLAFDLASPRKSERMRAHIEQCADCLERLEAVRRRFEALDLVEMDEAPSDDLIASTLAGIEGGGAGVPGSAWAWPRIGWAAAAAAIAVALVTVGVLTRSPDGGQPPGRSAPTVLDTRLTDMPRRDPFERAPFAPASNIELVTLPRRESVQLTIYNSADLTLVRERRLLTMNPGWNWLQFSWANTLIDPTSLSLEPDGGADGIGIEQLVFPPRYPQLGRWLIRSEVDGQVPFEITYLTSGLSWRAFYMGTLSSDEKSMDLQGYVRVSNHSGEDYADAQVRMIVGKVNLLDQIAALAKREHAYGRPGEAAPSKLGYLASPGRGRNEMDVLFAFADADEKMKEIVKEGLSEYFLYTIEGTETIPHEWAKRLPSFDVTAIPVKSLYKYDEQRWGRHAVRFVGFANDETHRLGQTPLPDGRVRIFRRLEAQGQLAYIGGTNVEYIPVQQEVELDLGPARLVKVEPSLMASGTEHVEFDDSGDISGREEVRTWRIDVSNARDLAIDVEITREIDSTHWTARFEQDGVDGEKLDATHLRFRLTVRPRTKITFRYQTREYHGTRRAAHQDADALGPLKGNGS
ncbi:MAG: hypothetical protein CMJ18_22260 [Phycisphaeraceae bacterium]|nr:hypothetical protein [Phycisphaeraceae bacterium]